MKSSRQAAMSNRAGVLKGQGRIDLGHEGGKILKRLERARNYGNKRAYNKELFKLVEEYPEYKNMIISMVWK